MPGTPNKARESHNGMGLSLGSNLFSPISFSVTPNRPTAGASPAPLQAYLRCLSLGTPTLDDQSHAAGLVLSKVEGKQAHGPQERNGGGAGDRRPDYNLGAVLIAVILTAQGHNLDR